VLIFQAGGKPSTLLPPGELVDQTPHTDQDFINFQYFQKKSNFYDFQIFMIFMKIMHHLRTESPQNIKNPHNVCVYDLISFEWHCNVITLVLQHS